MSSLKLIETRLECIDLSLKLNTKYILLNKGNAEHVYFDNKQINHKLKQIITIKNEEVYTDYYISFIQYIYSEINYKFLYKLITAVKK